VAKKITKKQKIAIEEISKTTSMEDFKNMNSKEFLLIKDDLSSFIVSEKIALKKDLICIPVKMLKKELGL